MEMDTERGPKCLPTDAVSHQLMTTERHRQADTEGWPHTQEGKYSQTGTVNPTHPASESLFSPLGSLRRIITQVGKTWVQTLESSHPIYRGKLLCPGGSPSTDPGNPPSPFLSEVKVTGREQESGSENHLPEEVDGQDDLQRA